MPAKAELGPEAEQLRQLIREAHEAAKDCRAARREMEARAQQLAGELATKVAALLEAVRQNIQEWLDHFWQTQPVQVLCSHCRPNERRSSATPASREAATAAASCR
jgi:dsDNA-specific endonuclease/ATPase MutS2